MPIEYEMKYLSDITEDAIRQFSEDHYAAAWRDGVEKTVLEGITNNTDWIVNSFRDYQLGAMKSLINRGKWLRHTSDGISITSI